jgi:hypothetical protein
MPCDDSVAVSAALSAALQGPARVSSDAGEVEQFPIGDLIKADQYVAAKCAAGKARRGLRFTRLVPDGAVQDGGQWR